MISLVSKHGHMDNDLPLEWVGRRGNFICVTKWNNQHNLKVVLSQIYLTCSWLRGCSSCETRESFKIQPQLANIIRSLLNSVSACSSTCSCESAWVARVPIQRNWNGIFNFSMLLIWFLNMYFHQHQSKSELGLGSINL